MDLKLEVLRYYRCMRQRDGSCIKVPSSLLSLCGGYFVSEIELPNDGLICLDSQKKRSRDYRQHLCLPVDEALNYVLDLYDEG